MPRLIYIGLAGAVGMLMRYWLSEWIAKRFGDTFPTSTLVVNLLGCFAAGVLLYLLLDRYPVSATMRAVVFVGLLGGFTTFSAFGLQTFTLFARWSGRFGASKHWHFKRCGPLAGLGPLLVSEDCVSRPCSSRRSRGFQLSRLPRAILFTFRNRKLIYGDVSNEGWHTCVVRSFGDVSR